MISRLLCSAALTLGTIVAHAADVPKDSPFKQAGSPTVSAQARTIEFAGVSTMGKRTMINLYDSQAKRSFWVEVGKTNEGVTALKYDSAHDQVTIRQNGVEKLLPLRPPSAVVSGSVQPATAAPVQQQPALAAAPSAPAPAAPGQTSTTSLSQARQEEEARMLVSDLLEIGMAQRKAYEEAQRKAAAAGQSGQPSGAPAGVDAQATATTGSAQAVQPAASSTPSGG